MPKKSKMKTPDWIIEGYDSKEEYEKAKGLPSSKAKKGRTFKMRLCPECGSDDVGVVLGQEEGKGNGEWECHKCKWKGAEVKTKEVSEDEFLNFLEENDG